MCTSCLASGTDGKLSMPTRTCGQHRTRPLFPSACSPASAAARMTCAASTSCACGLELVSSQVSRFRLLCAAVPWLLCQMSPVTHRMHMQDAVAALSSERIKQLLLIQTSGSYRDRLTRSLERTAGQEAKFQRCVTPLGLSCNVPALQGQSVSLPDCSGKHLSIKQWIFHCASI